MTQSPDHPDLPFVQARYYTKGRGGRRVLWIVIHDMEAGESSTRAENTAEYFRTMPDGRTVSSHYTVDRDSVIQCVRLADTAYTVGNRPGNQQGINWELSGFARQTREDWLDEFGLAMFRQMAPYVRADAERFGIPLRRCTLADLRAERPGVTSHNDLGVVFGGTTHTDPGPNFPWDIFMNIMAGEDDDMPLTDADVAKILGTKFGSAGLGVAGWTVADWLKRGEAARLMSAETNAKVSVLGEQVAKLTAAGGVDGAALKALLLDPEVLAAIAEAVADEQARRGVE